jgi:hydroxymethylpyrimidine/phosphomethylpyrimidine kinase
LDRAVVLSIAGSDNSAGAGLQADLKTISALGGYGLTAVTCAVAEVPGRVSLIQPVRPAVVAEQIRLCFEAFPIGAVKTGMLFSEAIIRSVAEALPANARHVVIDPVMVASSGDPLLKPSAIRAYRRHLFPKAALLTPNADELAVLTGRPVRTHAELRDAGRALMDETGTAILLKGGHLKGKSAVDYLATPGGLIEFAEPFVRGVETHGTGCTYSAAIATGLAQGRDLVDAVARAKCFLTRAIRMGLRWGKTGGLDHFA